MQARPLLSDGKIEALVDPRLGGDYDGEQARRVAFVASLCVRAPATWRASMTEVRASLPLCVVSSGGDYSQVNLEWQVTVPTPLSASEALRLHYCQLAVFFLFGLTFPGRRV